MANSVRMSGRVVFSPNADTVLTGEAEDVLVPLSNEYVRRANLVYKTITDTPERLPGSGVAGGENPGAFFVLNLETDAAKIAYIGNGEIGAADFDCWPQEFNEGVFHPNYDPWVRAADEQTVNLAIFYANE